MRWELGEERTSFFVLFRKGRRQARGDQSERRVGPEDAVVLSRSSADGAEECSRWQRIVNQQEPKPWTRQGSRSSPRLGPNAEIFIEHPLTPKCSSLLDHRLEFFQPALRQLLHRLGHPVWSSSPRPRLPLAPVRLWPSRGALIAPTDLRPILASRVRPGDSSRDPYRSQRGRLPHQPSPRLRPRCVPPLPARAVLCYRR